MTGGDPGDGRRLYTVGEIDEAIRRTSCDIDLTVEDVILILLNADPRPIPGLPALVRQVFLALTTVLAECRVEPVSFSGTASGPRSGHVEGDAEQLLFSRNVEIAGGGEGPGAAIAITPRGMSRIEKKYEALPAGTRAELSRKRAEWASSAPVAIQGDVRVRGGRAVVEGRPGEEKSAFKWDVFIPYAHEDGGEVATEMKEGLVRRGLRVWLDDGGLSAGDKVSVTIMEALASSAYAVAVISPAYTEKRYTMIELGGMLAGLRRDRIIPILYKTSYANVAHKLPMLADTYMKAWDDNDPKPLLDEIECKVKDAKDDARDLATEPDGDATDRDLMDMAGRGAAESILGTIGESAAIDRSEEIGKIKELLEDKGRVAVVGDRGSGKSVLSRLLYEDLAASEAVLLVRCDDFLGIESAEELDRAVVHGRSLVGIVSRATPGGAAGRTTIIFDSLDAAGRNEKTMRAFRRLFGMVRGAGARTVVTVRSYDYGHSPLLGKTDWGSRYDLGPLPGAEIDRILCEIGSPPVPPRLKELLAVPLNLQILSLVLKRSPGADLASIRHEIDLYDIHWHHYVELDPLKMRIKDELYDTAEAMFKARKTTIPYSPGDQEAAEAAQSSNMLERTGGGGMIRYFHHAYLDYVMSRALLERHQPLADYLRADEHNVFLLPTLSLTFAMAHEQNAGGFAALVEEIARADIRHYWKNAVLAALAAVPHDEGCGTCLRLEGLLADRFTLQRHFLMSLAKQPPASWFFMWGGVLAGWAADPDNPNGAFIIGCLEAAAVDALHHDRVFAIARALAERNKNGWLRKKTIMLLPDICATGKAELLEAMSTDADPLVRSGVASNLPRLLEDDPSAFPAVFSNLYSYEETSGKKTAMGAYGTTRLTSTMAQDNYMIRCNIDEMLPALIKANPAAMLQATILVAERISDQAAARLDGDPVGALLDAGGWAPLLEDLPLLRLVGSHVGGCSDADFAGLVPMLAGTALPPFRRMLIDGMAARGHAYVADLAKLLSDEHTYEAYDLRRSVRGAIRSVAALLDGAQAGSIYRAISASNAPRDGTRGGAVRSKRARAPFLSELPRSILSAEDRSIVDEHSRPASEGGPIVLGSFKDMPSKEPARDPLSTVKELLGCELDRTKKIALLDSMVKVLGDAECDLDGALLSEMEAFLLHSKADPDPDRDNPANSGSHMVLPQSVRGLVAECMIRTLPRRKSDALLGAIRELSDDPINLVRSNVARSLNLLLPDHYDTARAIALAYSRDPDPRVQFFLPAILPGIAKKEPALASAMIGNALATSRPGTSGVTSPLLALAIGLKEAGAVELLGRIANEGAFAEEARLAIPFALNRGYLGTGHQDAALDVLYGLLGDPSPNVRHKAAFFTLNGFDDNPDIDNRAYIAKIAPHLDRMVVMIKDAFDMGIAEPLASFLEKFWKDVPDTAIACLEAIVGHGTAVTSEASMADRSLKILEGLLSHHSLYDDEWNRCIDVLDAFAAVGWPAALDLLAEMGRRD